MGKRREVSKMLSVSDGYWGFVNKKRFYRYAYAVLTLLATFGMVAGFFDLGESIGTTEHIGMLFAIYVFYPTPLIAAWVVVYFGKFWFCWRTKRLRKAHNYKYNLLLASIVMGIGYAIFFDAYELKVIKGPRLSVAVILLLCQCGLTGIELFDMHKTRQARHTRKRLLRMQQELEDAIIQQLESGESMEEGGSIPPPAPLSPVH